MSEENRGYGLLSVQGLAKIPTVFDRTIIEFGLFASSDQSQVVSQEKQRSILYDFKISLIRASIIQGLEVHDNLVSVNRGFIPEYPDEVLKKYMKPKMYHVSETFRLEVPSDKAAFATDLVVNYAVLIGYQPKVSNHDELRDKVLGLAVEDAKNKAQAGAKRLGVKVDLSKVHSYADEVVYEGKDLMAAVMVTYRIDMPEAAFTLAGC